MTRDEVKAIIEGVSKEQLDAIMSLYGDGIEATKEKFGKFSELEEKVSELEGQLKNRDTQLTNLKPLVEGNETLTKTIKDLEATNKTATKNYEAKISNLQKSSALELALINAKAKNTRSVLANLDETKIEYQNGKLIGLDEQLNALKTSEETFFLFNQEPATQPPVGTTPSSGGATPPADQVKSLRDAVGDALKMKG